MASDGVWDNLYDKDVLACINQYMPKNRQTGLIRKTQVNFKKLNNIQNAADCIALEAEKLGVT